MTAGQPKPRRTSRKLHPISRARAIEAAAPEAAEWFQGRVEKGTGDACSMWRGARLRDKRGGPTYGSLAIRGRHYLAHRLASVIAFGPLPAGVQVCHTCDVPGCVRSSHLFRSDQAGNVADMDRKGRRQPTRGEQHARAKLSAAQALQIRRRLAGGAHQAALAAEVGVGQTAISRIARGERWAHLPGPRTSRRQAPGAMHLLVLRAMGWPDAKIAAVYCIAANTVSSVMRWKPRRRAFAVPLAPDQIHSIAPFPILQLTEQQLLDLLRRGGGLRPAA